MSEPFVHVVEDDEALRDSLKFMLKVSGLPARTYASGTELLAAVAEGKVTGCVVTDLRMPEMSGLELLQRLRASGTFLPVILMTGHGDRAMALQAKAAGAIDFFEKPFEEQLFLEAVRRALVEPAPRAPAPPPRKPRSLLDLLAGGGMMRRKT